MKLIGTSYHGVQVEKEFSPDSHATWLEFTEAIQAFIHRWTETGDPLVSYTFEESISVLD